MSDDFAKPVQCPRCGKRSGVEEWGRTCSEPLCAAYVEGYLAAEEQARGDRERAQNTFENQLNEIAKLRMEIERLRRGT